MKTPTPIESLDKYTNYIADGGTRTHSNGDPVMSDAELQDLIIAVNKQKPNAEGLPTDKDKFMSINNALYYHFNEEE